MKVVTIEAEIPKGTIQESFDSGRIAPCGGGVPELEQADIDDAVAVVAQMGLEPWAKAMEAHPDFDIIIAGRSYDPAPYAAFCLRKEFQDLGLAYHMGKIMECGAACAVPKSAEALATVWHDSFDICALHPAARCTPLSIAAHTLYEKSRPDLLAGPGGVLGVIGATFEQLADGRTLRVRGSKFLPHPEGRYTVKLEAARTTGYMAILFGSICDPIMISQLDRLSPMIRNKLRTILAFEFRLGIQFYGKDRLGEGHDHVIGAGIPTRLGILVKALAPTQEQAKAVVSMAKVFLIHTPYAGQLAAAGNLAMPFSPCDISLGPAAEFCMYHLMGVDDPTTLFPIASRIVGSSGRIAGAGHICRIANWFRSTFASNPKPPLSAGHCPPVRPMQSVVKKHSLSSIKEEITAIAAMQNPLPLQLNPPPPPGLVYLASLAKVVRTKNCGPFELTIDVMFPDAKTYKRVFDADVLNRDVITRIYAVEKSEHVLACLWWDPALAFKTTIKRQAVSGSFDDNDVHGSGAHVPLIYLLLAE